MSDAERVQAQAGGAGAARIWAGPRSAWDAGTGDAEFGSSPARHSGVCVNPSEDISTLTGLNTISILLYKAIKPFFFFFNSQRKGWKSRI